MKRRSLSILNFVYRKLFNYFPGLVYWVDSQGYYLGGNGEYCQFIKLKDESELIGRKPEQLLADLGWRFESQSISSNSHVVVNEKTYFSPQNDCKSFKVTQITYLGITVFIEDEISVYLHQIQDLEKQISNIKIIKEQTDAYLTNVIQIVPASIYWKDTNSVILGSNLFHTKLAGFLSSEDVIGKTEHDFVWKEQALAIIENDQNIMKLGKGIRLEETATLTDGETHTFLTSKEPLRDKDNNVIGIIGISLDITEQKQAEIRAKKAEASAILAKSKASSEEEMRKTVMVLVGDIVHDLRTPIATIRTVASLLADIFPNVIEIIEEAQQLGANKVDLLSKKEMNRLRENTIVNSIYNSVKTMDDFINATLKELSSVQKVQQQGGLSYDDLIKCSSRRVLENTLEHYFLLDSGIKISQNISYDFYLMGNSILIMKILLNLIVNAVDQIKLNGRGEIFISTEDAGDKNVIKIKDTAGGAPPEVIANFFEDYFTTKKEGTGIGLAFCKRTMNSFGADVTFNNIYGESIEFSLSFPKVKE